MNKSYRPWIPRQSFLLPPSPMEWLPDTHLVYFVLDVLEELTLQKIEDAIQEKDGRGNRPFDPRLMTVLLLYGYCVGIRSSRKLEAASYSDVAFRVLTGGAHPDHSAISEFRRVHLAALIGLFVQVLQLCQKADLAKKREQDAARELQASAKGGTRAELQAAREAHASAQKSLERLLSGENRHGFLSFPAHQVPSDPAGNPRPTAQRCFTDPDSRIQKSGGGYLQGYNGQAAVDEAHQIVVACALTNQPPDVEHLAPMLAQIETNCGVLPDALTADAGYWSVQNAEHCKQKNVDAFISVQRDRHGALPAAVPSEGTADEVARREMREKLRTPSGRKIYARRKAVVEPVFGQIKEVRGIRRFLLRGIEKAGGEWSLINTTHNILKLFRADQATKGRLLAVAT